MSVKVIPMFAVMCDFPGCVASAQDDGDYTAWGDVGNAIEEATNGDWRLGVVDGTHYCPDHPARWQSDLVDGADLPPPPPYLLIEDSGFETRVRLINH